jgi:hypothetical protein
MNTRLPDDCIGLIQDSVQFERAKARLGEPGLSFASNFIVAGGEKQSDRALLKPFVNQSGSAHLICLEVEIDLATLIDLPAGHPVILKVERYDSLDVS